MERLREELKAFEGAKILDVGTGNGAFIHFLMELLPNFESITGVDTHERSIDAANKAFDDERISFKLEDIMHSDFEPNSFDIVCLSNTLHHLEDIDEVIGKMKELVKTSGIILINEMVSDNLNDMQKSHMYLHHFAADIDRELGQIHNYTFKKSEIDSILSKFDTDNISWELEVELRKDNTKEEIDWMSKTIDMLLKRTEEFKNHEEFKVNAEKVRDYITSNGYDGATSVVTLMKKR